MPDYSSDSQSIRIGKESHYYSFNLSIVRYMKNLLPAILTISLISNQVSSQVSYSQAGVHGTTLTRSLLTLGTNIVSAGQDSTISVWSNGSPPVLASSLTTSEVVSILVEGDSINDFYAGYSSGRVTKIIINPDNTLTEGPDLTTALGITALADLIRAQGTDYIVVITATNTSKVDISKNLVQVSYIPSSGDYTCGTLLSYTTYLALATSTGDLEVRDMAFTAGLPVITANGGVNSISALENAWQFELFLLGYTTGAIVGVKTRMPNVLAYNFPLIHTSAISSMLSLSRTEYLVSADTVGKVCVWRISSTPWWTAFQATLPGSSPSATYLAESSDKKRFLVGGSANSVGAFFEYTPWGLGCSSICASGQCTDYSDYGCTACAFGYVMDSASHCAIICPAGRYTLSNNNTCELCDPACLTCTGSTDLHCTSCAGGNLVANNRSCVATCPVYEYPANSTHCGKCFPTCNTCSGPDSFQCLTCRSGFIFDMDGRCVQHCSLGGYPTPASICSACDPSCEGCKGPLSTDCTSCRDTAWVQLSSTGECVDCGTSPNHRSGVCDDSNLRIASLWVSDWNYEQESSVSLSIRISNQYKFREAIESLDLNKFLLFTIPSLVLQKDFITYVSLRNQEITVDLNFSSKVPSNSEFTISAEFRLDQLTIFNRRLSADGRRFNKIIIGNSNASTTILTRVPPSLPTMKLGRTMGVALNEMLRYLGWISLPLTIFLLWVNVPATLPFLNFARTVPSLTYLHHFRGPQSPSLEGFLEHLAHPYRLWPNPPTDPLVPFTPLTRPTLRRHQVPVLSFLTLTDKVFLYAVISYPNQGSCTTRAAQTPHRDVLTEQRQPDRV
jgi:hypothetical protein